MLKKRPVTLIIPFNEYNSLLNNLLRSIIAWSEYPSEIIIIDNSKFKTKIFKANILFLRKKKINLKIIRAKNTFPGAARNIAIHKSSNNILCFLDISTSTKNFWFEKNYKLIINPKVDIVYGKTFFLANSFFEKILRASLYGSKPVRTLPGSFIKKKIFKKINLFHPKVRAGEDGQFFFEILKKKIKTTLSEDNLIYRGLLQRNFLFIINKWARNYSSIAKYNLSYLNRQKILYMFLPIFTFFSLFLVKNKFLYIFLLFTIYFIIRALIIPLLRARKKDFFFIILTSLFIACITLFLDLIKLYSFIRR